MQRAYAIFDVVRVSLGDDAQRVDVIAAHELRHGRLAHVAMVALGTDAGVNTVALLTNMQTPLGLTAGTLVADVSVGEALRWFLVRLPFAIILPISLLGAVVFIVKTFILVFAVLVGLQGLAMAARSILVLAGREDDLPQHLRYKRHETAEPVL